MHHEAIFTVNFIVHQNGRVVDVWPIEGNGKLQ